MASKEVLQCIEESLDSKILSIEISGKPLQEIKAHPDFTLIATQNPNKGLFSGKRQDLGLKFLSRFQVIEFPELFDELNEIAEGLGKRFGYLSDEEKSVLKWDEKPNSSDSFSSVPKKDTVKRWISDTISRNPNRMYL